MILNSYSQFLDRYFTNLNHTGIDLSKLELDHLGYQTSSSSDYESIKEELLNHAKLGKETIFKDRRIGIFILNIPLKYKTFTIDIVEVIEPIKGEVKKSNWEHVEFTPIEGRIDDLAGKYPKLDWETTALNRDIFPMLKLRISNNMQVKFPRKGLKDQLCESGLY